MDVDAAQESVACRLLLIVSMFISVVSSLSPWRCHLGNDARCIRDGEPQHSEVGGGKEHGRETAVPLSPPLEQGFQNPQRYLAWKNCTI